MNEAIEAMLSKHRAGSLDEQVHALKEIIQEVALLGLWRARFFEHGAFYGGTALRLLYGLPRFSEDLDFSLLAPAPAFRVTAYESALQRELESFDFEVSVARKEKRDAESRIESAFIKANTLVHLIKIRSPWKTQHNASLRVKLEIDTDPPGGFETEVKQHFQPIPFSIRAFTPPCLFAGKLHACLCRTPRDNVKGRDWYDFLWFVSRDIPVHLGHLQRRMEQTGDWKGKQALTRATLVKRLGERISALDIGRVKREVAPFVRRPSDLDGWDRALFLAAIDRIRA